MAKTINFTTLDRVISKVYRDLGIEGISEKDLIEWSAEALEFFSTVNNYENAVQYLEIKDHQVELPKGLISIVQIARDNYFAKKEDLCVDETQESESMLFQNNNFELSECEDCLKELDFDLLTLRDYNEIENNLPKINIYFPKQKEKFTPVRLATHSFFNSLVCPENPEIYKSCKDEYTIVKDKLRTSFKEGGVLISYYRIFLDKETGYPLIPDNVETTTAIQYYITWKYFQRMWFTGREEFGKQMQYAEERWLKYCHQARINQKMPSIDELQNLMENKFHWIKKFNYYNFFGNIGKIDFKLNLK